MLNSISNKTILLFLLFSCIPLLTIRLIGFPKVRQAFQEVRIRDLESVGHKQAELITAWMKERKDDAMITASEYLIKSFLKFNHGDKEFKELISYIGRVKDNYGYKEISLADVQGKIRVSTREDLLGLSIAGVDYLQEALKGNVFVTRVHPSTFPMQNEFGEMEQGVPTLFVSSPIRDEKDDIIGVLSMRMDVEVLSNEMRRVKLGETGETYLMDENGYMITESRFASTIRERGLIKKRTILELKLVDPTTGQPTRGVQTCLKGKSGYDAKGYPDYRGVKVMGFWHWIPEYHWGLMSEIDVDEAYRDLYVLERTLLCIALAFTLVAIVAAVYIGRRLTSPILHLTEMTERMSNGELNQRVVVDSRDEVGVLAKSFNTMAEIIEKKNEQLESTNRKLEELSITDALTGLYNRRYLEVKLNEEIVRANRYRHPLSLIFVDIDHFKKYNDSYGHPEGDKVLKGLAGVILDNIRKKIDIACRYGGEEFVVVLPVSNDEHAVIVADRVRKGFSRLVFKPEGVAESVSITLSAGVTSLKTENSADFLNRADHAMYQAKFMGRNKVVKL